MPRITITFDRGTYVLADGSDSPPALLLFRSDRPGQAYPFSDDKAVAEAMARIIKTHGPEVLDDLLSTREYSLWQGITPARFSVLVTDLPSDGRMH